MIDISACDCKANLLRKKRKMRWKSKDTKKVLIGLGLVLLVLFLVSRFYHPKPKAAHKPSRPKTTQKASAPVPVSRPVSVPPPVRTFPSLPKMLPRELHPGAPKIVFIIDDVGHTMEFLDDFKRLGNRVTYAILPFLKNSAFFDRVSVDTGAEVILHIPLESVNGTIPGPGLIRTNMSNDYVLDILDRELDLLPHCIGANNHMGSKGSADPWLMEIILNRLKKRNLIFLDSRTTSQSVAPQIAAMINLPILKRDVFLDNDPNDLAAIREQVKLLADIARKRGYAIGIGHYHGPTLRILNEEIPRLQAEGFDMVSLRDLLRLRKSQ